MEKFQFDRIFASDGSVNEPKPRARRTYRAEEVEAIRAGAFSEGEKSSVARAEQAAAAMTNVIAAKVDDLINTARVDLDEIRDESTRLAALIARKFVNHMIEKAPELFLERCIDACLEIAHKEPQIKILIPLGAAASLKQRFAILAQRHSHNSALRVEESADLKEVACRLEWRTGGAEISLEESLSKMDQIIEEHIATLSEACDANVQEAQEATA